jgi:hypothetical protein
MCSINHEKKAIFIHVPKTAGTFCSENLEKFYGFKYYQFRRPDHDEIVNTKSYINNIIENYKEGNKIYYLLAYFKHTPHNRKMGVYEYASTSDYLNKKVDMNDEKWKSYYKFAFVRNPYERFISGYSYSINSINRKITFEDYLNSKEYVTDFEYFHTFMPQSKHIFLNENNICNFIGNFENLEDDLKQVLLNIGFKEDEIIHEHNIKNKSTHNSLQYYIKTQDILNKLNNVFEEDFRLLKMKKIEKLCEL